MAAARSPLKSNGRVIGSRSSLFRSCASVTRPELDFRLPGMRVTLARRIVDNSSVCLIVASKSLSVLTARKWLDAASRSITPLNTLIIVAIASNVSSFLVFLMTQSFLATCDLRPAAISEFTLLVKEHGSYAGMRSYDLAKPVRQDLPYLDNQIVVIFKGI